MLALEYSALGLLAGAVGARRRARAELGRLPLRLRHRLAAGAAGPRRIGALSTMALVGVIGVVASADVLRKKPLATLRAE